MPPFVIFKTEEYNDPITGENLVIVWSANREKRVAFLVEDFFNFVFLELPFEITKKEFKKIMGKVVPEFGEESWSFIRWEKYQLYPPKKYPFVILYGKSARQISDVLSGYFLEQAKRKTGIRSKKELKEKFGLNQFYGNYTVIQKFSAITGLNVGDWFEIENYEIPENYQEICRIPMTRISQAEMKAIPAPDSSEFPIYKISCIDFEVNSHRKGKFPDPWEPPDKIYLTSFVIGFEKDEKDGFLITTEEVGIQQIRDLKDSKPCPVIVEEDEILALRELERLIMEEDPDFIFTYNGDSFDFPYWKARFDREGEELRNFGRLVSKNAVFKRSDWSSSAIKSKGKELLAIPGRVVVDLFTVISREHFYDLYTLKYVSEKILNSNDNVSGEDVGAKDELSAEEQFRIYREGNKEEWYRLLHYSLRDSFTPLRIIDKIGTINKLFAMSRIIGLNIEELYTRGQQHRLDNKIFQDRIKGKVVIDPSKTRVFKKFKGAVVQDPLLKLMRNVATIDFQSLYPSIMIALNISHDTYIGMNIHNLPEGLTEEDINIIEVEENKVYYFVKRHIKVGTIPKLLVEFLDSRATKKEQMKSEKDEIMKSILDGEQLALKVIANSSYGFLGAMKGKLPLKEGAESVTAIGRKLIMKVVSILKEKYGAIIVYGDTDSVFFTFDEWQDKRGQNDILVLMDHTKVIAEDITNQINLNPIKIVLDHFYSHCLIQTKKCYLANEIEVKKDENKNIKLDVKLSFHGVMNARREHCKWAKNLYAELSRKAVGEPRIDDDSSNVYKKRVECEEIIFRHIMDLLERRTDPNDLTKISQMGVSYKSKSAPLFVFQQRENEHGRPITAGERFRFWISRSDDPNAKIGERMRRVLEEGEHIDRFYYIDKLLNPFNRLMKGVFGDNKFYLSLSKQIKLKEKLMIQINNEPYPHKRRWIRKK